MKILLFGKHGQLGWELNRSLQPLGELVALGRSDADFTEPESLRAIVRSVAPDIIVNAVAYTAVDRAEQEEALAAKINADAVRVLAEESLKQNALLVHYSTDYVFDGTKTSPYVEDDRPSPVNAYGRTKLAGETAILESGCDYLIFRTSWVYASRGHNFLLTMVNLLQQREELNIVDDQIGAPTPARLIADTTMLCVQQASREKLAGDFSSAVYHVTASGHTSWYGFTGEIFRHLSNHPDFPLSIKSIRSIPTSGYPTPARRPLNSRLDVSGLEKKFNIIMPHWKNLVTLCIDEITAD